MANSPIKDQVAVDCIFYSTNPKSTSANNKLKMITFKSYQYIKEFEKLFQFLNNEMKKTAEGQQTKLFFFISTPEDSLKLITSQNLIKVCKLLTKIFILNQCKEDISGKITIEQRKLYIVEEQSSSTFKIVNKIKTYINKANSIILNISENQQAQNINSTASLPNQGVEKKADKYMQSVDIKKLEDKMSPTTKNLLKKLSDEQTGLSPPKQQSTAKSYQNILSQLNQSQVLNTNNFKKNKNSEKQSSKSFSIVMVQSEMFMIKACDPIEQKIIPSDYSKIQNQNQKEKVVDQNQSAFELRQLIQDTQKQAQAKEQLEAEVKKCIDYDQMEQKINRAEQSMLQLGVKMKDEQHSQQQIDESLQDSRKTSRDVLQSFYQFNKSQNNGSQADQSNINENSESIKDSQPKQIQICPSQDNQEQKFLEGQVQEDNFEQEQSQDSNKKQYLSEKSHMKISKLNIQQKSDKRNDQQQNDQSEFIVYKCGTEKLESETKEQLKQNMKIQDNNGTEINGQQEQINNREQQMLVTLSHQNKIEECQGQKGQRQIIEQVQEQRGIQEQQELKDIGLGSLNEKIDVSRKALPDLDEKLEKLFKPLKRRMELRQKMDKNCLISMEQIVNKRKKIRDQRQLLKKKQNSVCQKPMKYTQLQVIWADPNSNEGVFEEMQAKHRDITITKHDDLTFDERQQMLDKKTTRYIYLCSNKTFHSLFQNSEYPFINCKNILVYCMNTEIAHKNLNIKNDQRVQIFNNSREFLQRLSSIIQSYRFNLQRDI